MNNAPEDITPKNGGSFPWTGKDPVKFENDYNMKPVSLKGYLDISKQVFIEKQKDNERGVEVIAPFYTHLNKND